MATYPVPMRFVATKISIDAAVVVDDERDKV